MEIIEYDEIRTQVDHVKDICNFIPNVTTNEGYEKSKRVSLDVGKLLTRLEEARKERKSYFLEGGRLVDSQAKAIAGDLESFQLPHKEAYRKLDKEKKEREAKRKMELEMRVDAMRSTADGLSDSHSSDIMSAMQAMQSEECLDFYEYTEQALKARNIARNELSELYQKTLKAEKDAEELEALRKAEAERQQREREENIKKEAAAKAEKEKQQAIVREQQAQQARINAEAAKIEAEQRAIEQAKQSRLDAIEAEKQSKIRAEEAAQKARNDELFRIEQEKKEEEKAIAQREANNAHVGKVRKSAKEALMTAGVSEAAAKKIVLMIHNNKIPNVTIFY